jgi:hypothetical protein
LSEPVPEQAPRTIAEATDYRVTASIEAVIVRDGPGTWAKGAFWDEYRIRLRVVDGWPVEISRVVVVDSLGEHHGPQVLLGYLKEDSAETTERYEDAALQVTAGLGGAGTYLGGAGAYMTGMAVGATSAGVGYATLGTAGAAASAATVGIVLAPVLMGAGIVGAVQEQAVQREMDRRRTDLPLTLEGGQERTLDLFFGIAPEPQEVRIRYSDPAGSHLVVIETRAALAGLHLQP